MKHYTSEELDQYLHKDMNFISRFFCRVHLYICSCCQKKMSQLRSDEALLATIKNSLNKLNIEPNSVTYQKIDTKIHGDEKKGTSV